MSTITLSLTATSLVATGRPASLTAAVTNAASVPVRVVLGAFPPAGGGTGAAPWTGIDRPLRDLAAGATEQFTVTITPPADAAAGSHIVRLIAYDADRAPEEYSDQARTVEVGVPAAGKAVAGTPWWIYAIGGGLVLVVAVVAFLALRGSPDPAVPTPTPTPSNPCPSPFVPRFSRPGDTTCVMPASAEEAQWDNRVDVQRNRVLADTDPPQCAVPYQPRLAFADDFVCVWEDTANRTHVENQPGYLERMFSDTEYPETFTPRR